MAERTLNIEGPTSNVERVERGGGVELRALRVKK
jgi:hypothetical protein